MSKCACARVIAFMHVCVCVGGGGGGGGSVLSVSGKKRIIQLEFIVTPRIISGLSCQSKKSCKNRQQPRCDY